MILVARPSLHTWAFDATDLHRLPQPPTANRSNTTYWERTNRLHPLRVGREHRVVTVSRLCCRGTLVCVAPIDCKLSGTTGREDGLTEAFKDAWNNCGLRILDLEMPESSDF